MIAVQMRGFLNSFGDFADIHCRRNLDANFVAYESLL